MNAINKTLSYLLAASAAALAAFPAVAGFANSITLPTNVVSALRKSAPILVSPMPAAKVDANVESRVRVVKLYGMWFKGMTFRRV